MKNGTEFLDELKDRVHELYDENHKLKEDLDYSNYCNEQLRKKIINLEYKIATLEEELKGSEK